MQTIMRPLKSKNDLPAPGQIWSLKKEARLALPEARLASSEKEIEENGGRPVIWNDKRNRQLEDWLAKRGGDAPTIMKGLSYKVDMERLVMVLSVDSPVDLGGSLGQFWLETSTVWVVPLVMCLEHAAEFDAILSEDESSTGLELMAECWNVVPILGSALGCREGTVPRRVFQRVSRLTRYGLGMVQDPGLQETGPLRQVSPGLDEWQKAERDRFLAVAEPRRTLIELELEGWIHSYFGRISHYEVLGYRPPRHVREKALSCVKKLESKKSIQLYQLWWNRQGNRH